MQKKNTFNRKTFLLRSNLYHDHFLILGARFAVYQSKVGLIKILRNYKVETCEKTPIPYVNNPKAFLLAPKDGLYLKIVKINRT